MKNATSFNQTSAASCSVLCSPVHVSATLDSCPIQNSIAILTAGQRLGERLRGVPMCGQRKRMQQSLQID